jgi:hypothetical protein
MTEEEFHSLRVGSRVRCRGYSPNWEPVKGTLFQYIPEPKGFRVRFDEPRYWAHNCDGGTDDCCGYNLWLGDLEIWDLLEPPLKEQLRRVWEPLL